MVRSIKAELGAGDDKIELAATLTKPAQLEGGAGNDTLISGAGNDKIEDEEGTNTVTGGAGRDIFEVNATTTITDFVVGVDKKEIED
jgi:Ca2+-binding RTX toxin-like protein